jgi:hypothetical protein
VVDEKRRGPRLEVAHGPFTLFPALECRMDALTPQATHNLEVNAYLVLPNDAFRCLRISRIASQAAAETLGGWCKLPLMPL